MENKRLEEEKKRLANCAKRLEQRYPRNPSPEPDVSPKSPKTTKKPKKPLTKKAAKAPVRPPVVTRSKAKVTKSKGKERENSFSKEISESRLSATHESSPTPTPVSNTSTTKQLIPAKAASFVEPPPKKIYSSQLKTRDEVERDKQLAERERRVEARRIKEAEDRARKTRAKEEARIREERERHNIPITDEEVKVQVDLFMKKREVGSSSSTLKVLTISDKMQSRKV